MKNIESHSSVSTIGQTTRAEYDIGILFFNRARQTLESVLSFLDEDIQPDIVILDQGSSAEQRTLLSDALENRSNVRIISLPQNIGVAAGRNRLCRECLSDWILFVDNDITLNTRDGIALINLAVRDATEYDGIIPRIFNAHDDRFIERLRLTETPQGGLSEKILPGNEVTNIFPGGAVVLRRSVLLQHPYDERYFVGFEDYELALRTFHAKQPLELKALDEVTLVHKHLPVSNEPDVASTRVRYSDRLIRQSFQTLKEAYGGGLFNDWESWVADQRKGMLDGRPLASRALRDKVNVTIVADNPNSPLDDPASNRRRYEDNDVISTTVHCRGTHDAGVALKKILDSSPHVVHFMQRSSFLQLFQTPAFTHCASLMSLSESEILDRFCQSCITFSVGDPAFLTPADIEKFRPFYWLSDGYCITSSYLTEVCDRNSDCPKPAALILAGAEPGLCWLGFIRKTARNERPDGPNWRRLMIEKFYFGADRNS
jgi:hypothetical protein